jgi:hypothetical protein
MRFSFVLVAGVLVAGPRRHLSQLGSIGIEPAYGNEDQAGAGHDRPEGFEIETELDVVDYIFRSDSLYVRARGNLTA